MRGYHVAQIVRHCRQPRGALLAILTGFDEGVEHPEIDGSWRCHRQFIRASRFEAQ